MPVQKTPWVYGEPLILQTKTAVTDEPSAPAIPIPTFNDFLSMINTKLDKTDPRVPVFDSEIKAYLIGG